MASSSDSKCDGGDSSVAGPATKKNYYKQAFNDEWLKDPELKDWIQRDPNEKYAVLCNICNRKLINTNRTGLIIHKSSNKHVKNSEARKNDYSMASSSISKCDGEDSVVVGESTKKKYYNQAFNDEWLNDPELKDWIQLDPNDKYAVLCNICDTKLVNTNRTCLIAHKSTNKHVKNSEAKKNEYSMASSSDSKCDGGDLTMGGPAKKNYYKQAFNDEWLKDPELKDWIQCDPNEKYAVFCKICNRKLNNTNRSGLITHKSSSKHVKNSEARKNDYSMASSSDSKCDGEDTAVAGEAAEATEMQLYYNQAFNDEWLNDPELKDWIQRDLNEMYAVLCNICNTKLVNTNRSGLIAHKSSNTHISNIEAKKNDYNMASNHNSKCDGEDSAMDRPATKKKLFYNRAFNDEWLEDPELRDWIQRDPNEKYAALCKICNTKLVNTKRTGLIAHKSSIKHVRNSEAKNNDYSMASSSNSKCDGGDLAMGGPATKKKLYYKQAFNDEWLKDPELKDWIQRDPNEKYAVLCNICNRKLVNMNRSSLIAHSSCNKHVKNSEARKNDYSMASITDSKFDGGDSTMAGPATKKKSYYNQAFNDEWLEDPELKDWIQRDPNEKYAVLCNICNIKLVNTNRSGLIAHKSSNKHVKNSEARKNDYNMASSSISKCDGGDLAMGGPATKKKLYYNQAFNDEWLKDPELKDWIQRDPNEKYAVLHNICNTKLINMNRTGLIAHKSSNTHISNSEGQKHDYVMESNHYSKCDGEDSAMHGPTTKKNNQAFNDEWLNDPELKDWIQRDPNDKYAVLCNICNTKLVNTNRTCLVAHKSTNKHVKNSVARKNEYSMVSSSDSKCDGGDSAMGGPATKKNYYKQAFNNEWLKDPELKEWIQCDPNDKYAVLCNICNRKLVNTNRTGLIAHKSTSKHVRNSEAKKSVTKRTARPKDNMETNSYSEQFLKSLESFRRDDRFCDTVIVVGEQQMKAHGVLLAAASSVFRAILESNAEPGLHFLNLSGYDFEVVEAALHFIYTGKLEVEMKYASSEKLSELLTSLEDLGLCLDQYRSCEMAFSSEGEEFLNKRHVKMEEGNNDEETQSNALRGDDRNSSTKGQLSSSAGLREIRQESVHDNKFHTSSISEEWGQCLEDAGFAAYSNYDSLVLNEVTSGRVLHSETGVHAVEITAGTLAKVQPGICNETLPKRMVKKKERQKLLCPTCGKTFDRKDRFTSHLRIHTGEKPYACDICHKMFLWSCSLRRHMRSHTGDKRFLCHLCARAFIQKTALEDHMAVHTMEKRHQCILCGKCFKCASYLRAHSRQHKLVSVPNGKGTLDQPELSDSLKPAESILTDNGFVRFVCKICQKDYATKNSLAIHEQQHCNTKSFACNVCKKSFWQRVNLERHKRTHTGERPFTCTTCGKGFSYAGGLSTHMRLHAIEKPYKCDICNSAYTQQAHLKLHLRTHPGEKPYECTVCGKKYRNKIDLRFHVKRNDACNKGS